MQNHHPTDLVDFTPAEDAGELIVGKGERGIERKGALEVCIRLWNTVGVEGPHPEEVLLIGVELRRPQLADSRIDWRWHREHTASERRERREQRILFRRLLHRRAKLGAGGDIEHVCDQAGAPAHLEEVAHHELARAGAPRDREAIAQRERRRGTRRWQFAQQVGNALVGNDLDIRPAADVERQEIDACVAQPVQLRRLHHVAKGDDDPPPRVECRVDSAQHSGHRPLAGRWRAVGALGSCDGRDCEQRSSRQQDAAAHPGQWWEHAAKLLMHASLRHDTHGHRATPPLPVKCVPAK